MRILFKLIKKIGIILRKKNHILSILSAKMNENIKISNGTFHQRTRFWNEGYIEIKDNFSIGCFYGGGYEGRITELQTREENAKIIIGENLATNNGLFLCARKEIILGITV